MTEEIISNVRQFLIDGQIKLAIDECLENIDSFDSKDQIILISAEFKELHKKEINGIEPAYFLIPQKNKIVNSILEILTDLEKKYYNNFDKSVIISDPEDIHETEFYSKAKKTDFLPLAQEEKNWIGGENIADENFYYHSITLHDMSKDKDFEYGEFVAIRIHNDDLYGKCIVRIFNYTTLKRSFLLRGSIVQNVLKYDNQINLIIQKSHNPTFRDYDNNIISELYSHIKDINTDFKYIKNGVFMKNKKNLVLYNDSEVEVWDVKKITNPVFLNRFKVYGYKIEKITELVDRKEHFIMVSGPRDLNKVVGFLFGKDNGKTEVRLYNIEGEYGHKFYSGHGF